MAFLTTNHKVAEEQVNSQPSFGPLEEGWYEVFITGVDPNIVSSQKGTPGIEVVFTVRDDVEQDGQRKKVWETLWVSPKAMVRIYQLLKVVGVPDGEDLEKEDIVKALKGKPVQIEVAIDTYTKSNGEQGQKNVVTFMGFKEANHGGRFVEEGSNDDPFATNGQPIDISDESLPF